MRDLNTDPNVMETVKPEFIFTTATKNFMNSERTHLLAKFSGVMNYMQYLVPISGQSVGKYIAPGQNNGSGPNTQFYQDFFSIRMLQNPDLYAGRGEYLRLVVDQVDAIQDPTRKAAYANLKAFANIMEVYSAWVAVDVKGAMPYKEAFLAKKGILYPKYDYSWDLYKQFDLKLKEQVDLLLSTGNEQINIGSQDYFYKGDKAKWIKFANALRIKIAQRFEKRDPAQLDNVLADVLKQDNPFMGSNADGCVYTHPSDHNDNIDDINVIRTGYSAGAAFVSYLKKNADPRLGLMVKINEFDPESENYKIVAKNLPGALDSDPLYKERYLGMPASPHAADNKKDFGVWISNGTVPFEYTENSTKKTITLRLISQLQGRFFVKNGGFKAGEASSEPFVDLARITMRTPVLTYSDFCFMMAEIAEKKGASYKGKDAKAWYEEGVTSSVNYYQQMAVETGVPYATSNPVSAAKISAYLAQTNIAYTGTQQEKLEKIYSQAWVNFLKHPEEAWAMWKRTGCPKFAGAEANGAASLERLYNNDKSQELSIPRREKFGRHPINAKEWEIAYKAMKSKDPDYGFDENDASGRVWWDKK